jgi:Rrf2 family protein
MGTRLGLYAALELARDPARRLSAADLARQFGVSAHHLAKVLRDLARAGLAEAERGAAGGYRFAGNARRTTLMDIVALFETEPGNRAAEPGDDTDIGRALGRVLAEIDEIAEATLRSVSLETLLRQIARQARTGGAVVRSEVRGAKRDLSSVP